MIALVVLCDVCSDEEIFSTKEDSKKWFSNYKVENHIFQVCKECQKDGKDVVKKTLKKLYYKGKTNAPNTT